MFPVPHSSKASRKTGSFMRKTSLIDKQKQPKPREENYSLYINKILKNVHSDICLSAKATAILNSFVNDIFEKILVEAFRLAKINQRNTISSWEIQTAVRTVVPGELAKCATCERPEVNGLEELKAVGHCREADENFVLSVKSSH
uniref:Core Histone H2A/H2B/H3 domain-containing protein n=1 Tax=Strigamia maritima TaxID=126957 RepID=T1IXM0_STRMM